MESSRIGRSRGTKMLVPARDVDLPLTKPRFSLSRLASRAFCQGIDVDTFKENVMTVMSRRAQDVLRGTKSGLAAYCFTISQVHQKPSYSSLAVGHLHYD
jgi:hypothetical protein